MDTPTGSTFRDEEEARRCAAKAEAFVRADEPALRIRRAGALPAETLRLLLPSNGDPLAPAEASRRDAFVQRLADLAQEAVLEGAGAEPADVEAPSNPLTARACAACRGSCCRTGADHAHLTEETVARALEAHPAWTLAELTKAYTEHLPAASYRNSCIYHGAGGCGLPRELRSTTCNRYLCANLSGFLDTLPAAPPPVLAWMFEKGAWTRTALLDDRGVTLLEEAPPKC